MAPNGDHGLRDTPIPPKAAQGPPPPPKPTQSDPIRPKPAQCPPTPTRPSGSPLALSAAHEMKGLMRPRPLSPDYLGKEPGKCIVWVAISKAMTGDLIGHGGRRIHELSNKFAQWLACSTCGFCPTGPYGFRTSASELQGATRKLGTYNYKSLSKPNIEHQHIQKKQPQSKLTPA